MIRHLLTYVLLAGFTLTAISACGQNKPTGGAPGTMENVRGKENKSGDRKIRPPE